MIEVNNFKGTKQCKNCSNVLTFDDTDIKELNQGSYEEYIVKCPVCGTHNQVCYINGTWK